MSEIVNVVVAFAVIVFIVRWATRGGGDREQLRRARNLLGFQPKHVTADMISTVQSMFPHIPRENIHYDLLRTGSVEVTSNKLLERGFLEAPPPNYFQLFPSQPDPVPAAASSSTASSSAGHSHSAAASSSKTSSKSNLITRFELQTRVESETKLAATTDAGGKAAWEETAERREASLRERKAQMVLAARNRLLEQQRQTPAVSP